MLGFFGKKEKDTVEITTPIKMKIPAPTRGKGTEVFPGKVHEATTDVSEVIWQGARSRPKSKDFVRTKIRKVSGVDSPDKALDTFLRDHKIKREDLRLDEQTTAHPVVLTRTFPIGQVIEINLSNAGWLPGNTTVYVISPNGKQALELDPTWHLNIDWAKTTIDWD